MNRAGLRQYVRDLSGLLVPTLVSDERVNAALNEAYWEVLTAEVWPFSVKPVSVNVTVGSATAELPLDDAALSGGQPMQRVLAVDVNVNGEWERLTGRTFTVEWPVSGQDAGVPSEWTVLVEAGVSRVVFDRKVEKATPVRVWLVAPTGRGTSPVTYGLLSDGDTPEFGDEFHPMLAYRAAAKLLVQENDDTPRSSTFMSEYSAFLQRMRSRYLTRGFDPIVMGSRSRSRRTRYLGWGS